MKGGTLEGGEARATEDEAVLIGGPVATADEPEFNPFLADAATDAAGDKDDDL